MAECVRQQAITRQLVEVVSFIVPVPSKGFGLLVITTLRTLYFQFLSHWMGYDHGDSFPFDFEPNGVPFS